MNLLARLLVATLLYASLVANAADLTPIKETCGDNTTWEFNSTTNACVATGTIPSAKDACMKSGGVWQKPAGGGAEQCSPPSVGCGDSSHVFANGACNAVQANGATDTSDYSGDCWQTFGPFTSVDGRDLPVGTHISDHQDKNSDLLTLIPAKEFLGFCTASEYSKADMYKVHSAELLASTSTERHAWAYGALTIPYRYHEDDRSFEADVNLGAFFGRRVSWGSAAALTFFGSFSVGTVKLNGTTNSTSAQALIGGVGVMGDFGSSTNGFKFGLVYGHDQLKTSDAVNYNHRKPWIGLEFAYNKPGN